jgi:tetrahydromethanopterin S-methyltransferase subunit D
MNLELYNTVEIPLSFLVGFKSYESLIASNTIQAQIEHYSDPKTIHIRRSFFGRESVAALKQNVTSIH